MEYRIEHWPSFTVAGFCTEMKIGDAFSIVPGLWDGLMKSTKSYMLFDLLQKAGSRPEGLLGVIGGAHGGDDDTMRYYQGVTTHVDAPDCAPVEAPAGMETYTVPEATWVIIEAGGEPKDAIQRVHKEFYTKWLPASGYKLADAPVIESYLPDHQRVWIAVEKDTSEEER